MRVAGAVAIVLSCALSMASVASAGATTNHVVGTADMQMAITGRDNDQAAQRARLQSLLSRPEVQEWAAKAGLDLERAQRRAATMQGDELQRLDSTARMVDAQLAGGDAVVIGSTALVIILLVIVILLVA